MKDVFLGSFCSSIVTVFFYISAYKVERKRVLEQYWNECRKLIIGLNSIDYMNIDYDKDIFVKFINEQRRKIGITEYYKQIKLEIPAREFENTKLIREQIKEDNKELLGKISKDACKKYIDEKIEELYSKNTKKINTIVNQYLNYLNQSTDNLNFILGDVEFFTGNANYIKTYELFQKLYDLRIKIQEAARHFRYYKEGEGRQAVVLSEILKLQDYIFRIEETEDSKIIYREFSDMMQLKLEEFRARIIYNIEPDKVEILPIYELIKGHKE